MLLYAVLGFFFISANITYATANQLHTTSYPAAVKQVSYALWNVSSIVTGAYGALVVLIKELKPHIKNKNWSRLPLSCAMLAGSAYAGTRGAHSIYRAITKKPNHQKRIPTGKSALLHAITIISGCACLYGILKIPVPADVWHELALIFGLNGLYTTTHGGYGLYCYITATLHANSLPIQQ